MAIRRQALPSFTSSPFDNPVDSGELDRRLIEEIVREVMTDTVARGARWGKDTLQTMPNSTTSVVVFDNELYSDFGDEITWDDSSLFTVNTPGWYYLDARIQMDSSTVGNRIIGIKRNLSTIARDANSLNVGNTWSIAVSTVELVSPGATGDTFKVDFFQNSGGNLNVQGNVGTHLTIVRLPFVRP